jgi:hypothetical protein
MGEAARWGRGDSRQAPSGGGRTRPRQEGCSGLPEARHHGADGPHLCGPPSTPRRLMGSCVLRAVQTTARAPATRIVQRYSRRLRDVDPLELGDTLTPLRPAGDPVNLVVEAGDAAIEVLKQSRSTETISRAMGWARSAGPGDRRSHGPRPEGWRR